MHSRGDPSPVYHSVYHTMYIHTVVVSDIYIIVIIIIIISAYVVYTHSFPLRELYISTHNRSPSSTTVTHFFFDATERASKQKQWFFLFMFCFRFLETTGLGGETAALLIDFIHAQNSVHAG